MQRTVFRLGLAACGVAASAGLFATQQPDWLQVRRLEFSAWQTAHPNVDAQIADLKAKTASLVASAGVPANDLAAPPVVRRVVGAITEVWDGPIAPPMVVIPAGSFTMGSPASEQGRVGNEGPLRRINISYAVGVSKYPVTRDEYAAYVSETRRPDGGSCYAAGDRGFSLGIGYSQIPGATWRDPGFSQTGRDPVVCVSWTDAQAYTTWLTAKTGRGYRLLSEAEWEYAARAGSTTARYWGDAASPDAANYGAEPVNGVSGGRATGADRWMNTSPVGSFPPNAFGLFDVVGNVSQWVQDCYQATYALPTNGAALECTTRVTRGAHWGSRAAFTRVAYRNVVTHTQYRTSYAGFRVARSL